MSLIDRRDPNWRSLIDRRDPNWRKWPEYMQVIAPLVKALKKRGYTKPAVGKGFWQKSFTIALGKIPVPVTVSHSGRIVIEGDRRRPTWLVLIGDDSYRSRNRARFPEPKTGFDFERMATAVEEHSTKMARAEELERDRTKLVKEWQRAVSTLPKALRAYGIEIDHDGTGASVTLRFEDINQICDVLRAAQDAGVDP